MGNKLAKSREHRRENPLLSINVDLPSKPYRFFDGREVKSFSVPTMVKIQRTTKRDVNHDNTLTMTTSVTFLRDEHYLIFGSICTDIDRFAFASRLSKEGMLISDNDNLSLVDLRLSITHVLINLPVRDVSMSSSCEHLGFLTYNGYSYLSVCPCNPTPRLGQVQIFGERNVVSNSTCCAFSPNGKWLAVGVCSDYFMTKSRSHLVIRQVGKYDESNDIDLTGGLHMRRHSPTGLLINLDFSPDSTLLAIGASQNNMFLVCTKTWRLLSVSVVGESADRATSLWAVFHPHYAHEQLITCTGLGRLEKWEVIGSHTTNPMSLNFLERLDEPDTMVPCCPTIAPNGAMLAIGLSNGKVLIVDPNLFNTLWVIWPEFAQDDLQTSISASSLCFSKSCQYLAVGYNPDYVTVWSLPRSSFTLKHFCRTLIISICPPSRIGKLPIPNALKQYLLYTAKYSNL